MTDNYDGSLTVGHTPETVAHIPEVAPIPKPQRFDMDKRAQEVVLRTAIRNMEVQQVQLARLFMADGDKKIESAVGYMNFAMDAIREYAASKEIVLNKGGMKT